MKKTILITGVAGLLGSRLAQHLLDKGYNVVGIDNLSGGQKNFIPKGVQFNELDLARDIHTVDAIFDFHKPEIVYHLAAMAWEGLSPWMRTLNYESNVLASSVVINNCIRNDVKRLVFTSSMAVYGNGKAPFHEDDPCNPIDPYGIAKRTVELDIMNAGEHFGMDWCIIRPHNVYGANQNIWDPYRNVLGIWALRRMNHEPLLVYGDGAQTRAFSYIDDSLEPLYQAGVNPRASKEIINLGGTEHHTLLECANLIANLPSTKYETAKVIHKEPRHEVKHAYATHDKSVDILAYNQQTSFEEGLEKFWNWCQTQDPKKPKNYFPSYELDKGIYSYWKK